MTSAPFTVQTLLPGPQSRPILRKYESLAKKEMNEEKKGSGHFQKTYERLIKHQRGGGSKTIIFFPGRWSALTTSVAETLAQAALPAGFNSAILRIAHPLPLSRLQLK